jgi:hypothetical protein
MKGSVRSTATPTTHSCGNQHGKIKVKSSLCLTKYYSMKSYEQVEV